MRVATLRANLGDHGAGQLVVEELVLGQQAEALVEVHPGAHGKVAAPSDEGSAAAGRGVVAYGCVEAAAELKREVVGSLILPAVSPLPRAAARFAGRTRLQTSERAFVRQREGQGTGFVRSQQCWTRCAGDE